MVEDARLQFNFNEDFISDNDLLCKQPLGNGFEKVQSPCDVLTMNARLKHKDKFNSRWFASTKKKAIIQYDKSYM